MGNIIYIKRSSGLVPTYSASALGGNVVPGLGIIAGGSLSNPSGYMNSEDYAKYRETTPSKVLCIKNMVSMRELEDNEEYEDLYDDVMEECKNYGKVLNIKIPRPNGSNPVSGIGKVYVEYANRDGASWAKEHLNGMTFKNRIVEVVNYPEENYKKNQFD